MGKITKLVRPLNSTELFKHILDINILALEQLERDNWEEWKDIFPMYATDTNIINSVRLSYLGALKGLRYQSNPLYTGDWKQFVHNHPKWFNTIKYTLYCIEELYFEDDSIRPEVVNDLWDEFFSIEEQNKLNFGSRLKIKDIIINLPEEDEGN